MLVHIMPKFLGMLLSAVLALSLPLATLADVTLKGEIIQGGLVVGKTAPNSEISLNGKPLKQNPAGYFVFGFDRDAKPVALLSIKQPNGEQWQQELTVKAREYDIQRIEGIKQAIVSDNKTEAEWQRIRDEAAAVANARKEFHEIDAFVHGFEWPVLGRISGVFGSQRVYNGKPGRPHYGVDIARPTGTPAKAPADGIITLAHDDMYYSGGTLIIDHGYGVSSTFLHLSKVLVEVGDKVKQGDVVAEIGAGGQATGPHLDWRLNWFSEKLDPQLLVPAMEQLLQEKRND